MGPPLAAPGALAARRAGPDSMLILCFLCVCVCVCVCVCDNFSASDFLPQIDSHSWFAPQKIKFLQAITQAWSPSSTYQQLLTVWWVTHSCVTHPCVTHSCVLPNLVGTHPCVFPTLVSCPPLCYPTLCYPGLCLPALCYPGHCRSIKKYVQVFASKPGHWNSIER